VRAGYDGNVRMAVILVCAAACGGPRADVVVGVDLAHPGASIAHDFAGASYETSALIGGAYFRADNAPLVTMFGTLGIHHLRIGGNEADRGPLPADADIVAALGFADLVDVPVMYTLRLKDYDAASAASTAKMILARDAARIECFVVGNEPSAFTTYAPYRDAFDAYVAAVGAPASWCGPDVFGGFPDWIDMFATDRGAVTVETTVHEYFGGNGTTCDAAEARSRLLSAGLLDEYQANHDGFAGATAPSGGFRISETNSYYNGGCIGASDAFASSLWGLDYLYWWAAHDARGVDFHTGDHVSGSSTTYSLFVSSPAGYHARPLGYAMAAFALGGRGRLVPVTLGGANDITAYATVDAAGTVRVTIINKASEPRVIAIPFGASSAVGWRLQAPAIDSTDGVTLGGAAIADDGSWTGASSPEPLELDDGTIRFTLDAHSAIVVAATPR